ncbi:MAG: C-terminal binding protein [Rhodoferax sp.]|nr:C-terminal binding protein [Rhodoferax sp.]
MGITQPLRAVRLNSATYPMEPEERQVLAASHVDLVEIEGQQAEEIVAAARDCDALLVVSSYVPAWVISQLTRCRTIARLGAGTDKIDVAQATQCGIVVSNVPDFCLGEQADHTMALLLSFARRLPYMQDAMRKGDWTARLHPGVRRIAGQTLGLIGFGASAQAVARRAAGFGLQLLAWTRSPANHSVTAARLGVTMVSLDQLLERSDFASIHLPLNAQTRHLLGAQQLARMRPSAVLINTSRGAIIDEAVLVDCLQRCTIAGAALDVFETIDVFAPPGAAPQHPLLALDNLIATPHCAGSSVESTRESKLRGAQHAVAVLHGHWPAHTVNPEVVPRFALLA